MSLEGVIIIFPGIREISIFFSIHEKIHNLSYPTALQMIASGKLNLLRDLTTADYQLEDAVKVGKYSDANFLKLHFRIIFYGVEKSTSILKHNRATSIKINNFLKNSRALGIRASPESWRYQGLHPLLSNILLLKIANFDLGSPNWYVKCHFWINFCTKDDLDCK